MIVFHIIGDLKQGGAESQLERLVTFSDGTDTEHVVISLKYIKSSIYNRLIAKGIKVHLLNFSGINFIFSFLKLRTLLKNVHDKKVVIQCWMYHGNFFGLLAAMSLGQANKVIWNIRRTAIPNGFSGVLAKICAKLSHYFPVTTVCCAQAAKKSHVRAGYNSRNMVVIHNGIDAGVFSPSESQKLQFRHKFTIAEGEVVIGMVGRYAPVKGHLYFLQALEHIALNSPQLFNKLKIVLVGRDIKDAVLLNPLLESVLLKDRLIILDETAEVWGIMQGFDLYCMPSESEGFPNVVAEAMACGVPAIVTDVGDAAIIVNNPNFVVPPLQPMALADGIIKYFQLSDTERNKMSYESRLRVSREFSIEAAWNNYLCLYKKIIG